MIHRRSRHMILTSAACSAVLLAILGSCSGAEPLAAAPTSTPSATTLPDSGSEVSASAAVVPADVADLAFLISAPVGQVLVSEGQVVHQGDTLITLDAPDLSYGVKAAQDALTSAQANEYIQSQGRRKWDGKKYVWVAGPPEQRELYHAQTLQAQAGLAVAEAELAQSVLKAPYDGTVVSISVSRGEVVNAGQVVLVMAGLKHLQLQTTDLSERDIARVHPGQPVSIDMKAFAESLHGTVSTIDPMAGRSADGDIVYKVTIELEQQPAGLMWGMTGDVNVDTTK
jgi:RND family efflux transporter MFP subunit